MQYIYIYLLYFGFIIGLETFSSGFIISFETLSSGFIISLKTSELKNIWYRYQGSGFETSQLYTVNIQSVHT